MSTTLKIEGETHLTCVRFSQSKDDTESILFFNGIFECFILEDEEREEKVPGKTRIPEGVYEIKLREEDSPMNKKYFERYPNLHKGMLWLQDVPGFEYIYIHIGNKHEHTDGCLLTGDSLASNAQGAGGVGYVGNSGQAYKRLYPKVVEALDKGNKVYITITSSTSGFPHEGRSPKKVEKKSSNKSE